MSDNFFAAPPVPSAASSGPYARGGAGSTGQAAMSPYGTARPGTQQHPPTVDSDWYTPSASANGSGTGVSSSGGVAFGYGGAPVASQQHQHQHQQQPQNPVQFTPMNSTSENGGLGGNLTASGSDTQLSGAIGSGQIGAKMGAPHSGGVPYAPEDDYENEPPLMEELGINIPHIIAKCKAVLLPVGKTASMDTDLMDDEDLYGPLIFAALLGSELLLSGKLHFSYIYGFSVFGFLAMTLIINLMSPNSDAVSLWRVMSILGYCLLPVNFLAAVNILIKLKNWGTVGVSLAALTILWCTVASTRLFERSCDMRAQRYLIAYPTALLYCCFVIITIF